MENSVTHANVKVSARQREALSTDREAEKVGNY